MFGYSERIAPEGLKREVREQLIRHNNRHLAGICVKMTVGAMVTPQLRIEKLKDDHSLLLS